jgi:hypothetical protein
MSNSTTVYGTTGRRRATTDETVVVLAGEQGPAGVSHGFNWRGDWNPVVPYAADDAVLGSNGQPYICLVQNSTNEDPTTTPASWDTLMGPLAATAVSFTPGSGIDATNVQAAIEEARTDLQDHVNALDPEHTNYQLKTGFPLEENGDYACTIAYDPAARRIVIAPALSSSFEFWVKGKRYEKVNPQVGPTHADAENGYFYYYDEDGVFQVSTTPWDLREHAPVAYVYYRNASQYVAYEERHTIYRDAGLHAYLHSSMGTQIDSGFALSNYTLNTDSDAANTPDVASGVIRDEDLRHAISAVVAGAYTKAYRTGSGSWQISTAQASPYFSAGSYVQYNQLSGTWQLTALGNGEFVNYYIYLTPSLEASKRVLFIPGQAKYSTLAAAQAESALAVDLGSLISQEIVAVWKITLATNAGYSSTGKIQIREVTRISLSRAAILTGTSPTVHNSLSGRSDADTHPASAITNTPAGNIAATTVQGAIDELDTEKVAKAGDTMTGTLIQAGPYARVVPTTIAPEVHPSYAYPPAAWADNCIVGIGYPMTPYTNLFIEPPSRKGLNSSPGDSPYLLSNQHALSVQIRGYSGGDAAFRVTPKVALYAAAQTGTGDASVGDFVYAANFVVMSSQGHPNTHVIGCEINCDNRTADADLSDPWTSGYSGVGTGYAKAALLINSSGTKTQRNGIVFNCTPEAGPTYLAKYEYGIELKRNSCNRHFLVLNEPPATVDTATILATQNGNGATTDNVVLLRNTNSSPTGRLLRGATAGDGSDLFVFDVAGNLTLANSLIVADSNFNLAVVSSNPVITLDSGGDNIVYNRASNILSFQVGSAEKASVDSSGHLRATPVVLRVHSGSHSGTTARMLWNTAPFLHTNDSLIYRDTISDTNDKIAIAEAGYYRVSVSCRQSVTGSGYLAIYQNSLGGNSATSHFTAAGTVNPVIDVVIYASANDYIYVSASSASHIVDDAPSNWISIERIN